MRVRSLSKQPDPSLPRKEGSGTSGCTFGYVVPVVHPTNRFQPHTIAHVHAFWETLSHPSRPPSGCVCYLFGGAIANSCYPLSVLDICCCWSLFQIWYVVTTPLRITQYSVYTLIRYRYHGFAIDDCSPGMHLEGLSQWRILIQ